MTSGIYQIRNTVNDKVYVGRTINLTTRQKHHFYQLRKGTHTNVKLQRAFAKYGEAAFLFEILEYCTPEAAPATEQRYIDNLDWEMSYNISNSSRGGDTKANHPNKKEWAENHSKLIKELWEIDPTLNTKLQDASRQYWSLPENQDRRKAGWAGDKNPMAGTSRTGVQNPFFGKTHSEEAKAILREKSKRKHTAESKAAMLLGRTSKYQVDGVVFDQLKDVLEHFGVSRKYVHRRLRSDDFPNWKII